jgi:hypothetical protein
MKIKRFVSVLAVILFCAFSVQITEIEDILKSISADTLYEINKTLASPEMEGRLSGTAGYNKAAQWAAEKFKEWGLKPVYSTSFLQPFKVGYNEMRETALTLIVPAKDKTAQPETIVMEIYKDFCPTLYSGFGNVETEVIFAGYGITAPELGWDDFKGIEVKGKIIAVFDAVPQIEGKDFSAYSHRPVRLHIIEKYKPAGIIFINRAVISGSGDYIEGLPMVLVGDRVTQTLFAQKGYTGDTVRAKLREEKYFSFATGVTARLTVKGIHHANAETYNVVGMVEGSDPVLKNEYIIFGGHLDHLGNLPVLHPGAYDNASGSTVVMGLAQAFSKLKNRPKRTIVFALFSAEELGLLGSTYMVNNLPKFPSKPILMSNHDMNGIGTGISISGGKTYPELYDFIQEVNARYQINNNITASEITAKGGNSDYAAFLEKGIPAYNNGTRGGRGPSIHSPEDTIDHITPKIMEDIVKLYFMAGYLYANR